MQTPFPGMDPYLERRGLWHEVHADLIVGIRQYLVPLLRPRYRVAIEQHTYLALSPPKAEKPVGYPDVLVVSPKTTGPITQPADSAHATTIGVSPVVGELPMFSEVKQRFLEVRDVETREVITAIEILSPANKTNFAGRTQYESKRQKVLSSLTHLIEIDLLRVGHPLPMMVSGQSSYRIVISRSQHRPQADIYLFGIRESIPDVPIPLRPGETELILPLNQILHNIYDQGAYDLAIDYQHPPEPQLLDEDAEWAQKLVTSLK